MPQLTALPAPPDVQAGVLYGVPMCISAQMQLALQSGHTLNALVVLIDEPDHELPAQRAQPAPPAPPEHSQLAEEGPPMPAEVRTRPPQSPRLRGRGHRGGVGRRLRGVPHETGLGLREAPCETIHDLCTEAGSHIACERLGRDPGRYCRKYAALAKGHVGVLLRGSGALFLRALLRSLPFGREAPSRSDAALVTTELADALPLAAALASGAELYLLLLEKCASEGEAPSSAARHLAERLGSSAVALAQGRHGSRVLRRAMEVRGVRVFVEKGLLDRMADVVATPTGLRFVRQLLEARNPSVAMALVESEECVLDLSGDEERGSLLVLAASFSAAHRAQLAETLRVAGPDRCVTAVRSAACWK